MWRLELRQVHQVLRLGERRGHVIGQLPFRAATPVERHGRRLDLDPAELAGEVLVSHVGKRGVEDVVILVDEIRQRIAHGDVRRGHADRPDELVEDGDDHLG